MMRVPGTPLGTSMLSAGLARHLQNDFWIETAEELIAVSVAAGEVTASALVESDLAAGRILFGSLAAELPPDESTRLQSRQPGGTLGCLVPTETVAAYRALGSLRSGRSAQSLPPTAQALPGSVRLFDKMPAVRNQGARGTCVAFGSAALREFLDPSTPGFSEQFLYWSCKQMDGTPDEPGTYAGVQVMRL